MERVYPIVVCFLFPFKGGREWGTKLPPQHLLCGAQNKEKRETNRLKIKDKPIKDLKGD